MKKLFFIFTACSIIALHAAADNIHLLIRSLAGPTIQVIASSNTTIANLKEQLQEKTGIPVAKISLVWGPGELVEDSTVSAARIQGTDQIINLARENGPFLVIRD